MPRLSLSQEEARTRVQYAAASGLSPARLGGAIAAALAIAVPSDGYRLFGIDPRTLLVNRLLAASEEDGWARTEWLREVYLAAEPLWYLELPNLKRANLRAVAFQDRQDICWGYPRDLLSAVEEKEHYRLFHELRSPVGGTLLAIFTADDQPIAALQWYRRDPQRPFRSGDVAFVNQLAPTIGKSIAASLARERAMRDGELPDASGILVLGPDGDVRFGTPAGETWLALLGRIDRGMGDPLPTAVRSAVAALRAGSDGAMVGTVAVPVPGGVVRVEASPAGADGAVAIVLSGERPPPPPSVPVDWPLTPQERQAVDLLIRGLGNRQIADRLFVSEHTVEWHLRHAYEKVGVRSRSQLLARLFHELYLPNVAVLGDAVTAGEPVALPPRRGRVA
jgi:DNA-binding CsgD family transcriptional regulator